MTADRCSWAACSEPSAHTDDAGWNHCAEHWREHLDMLWAGHIPTDAARPASRGAA